MYSTIDIDELKILTKSLEGRILKTKSHKKDFLVNVLDTALVFIPSSSGKSRKEPFSNLIKVIDHFNETKSLQPKDFQDITRNSVYILHLIEVYLKTL